MKVLRVLVVLLAGALVASAFAQDSMQGTDMKSGSSMQGMDAKLPAHAKVTKAYVCDECHVAMAKGGKCPMCGKKLMAVKANVVYECPDCHTMSAKAGKCPKCGKKLEKRAVFYACEDCHTTSTMAGKCPKCGKEMKRQDVPLGMPKMHG